MLLHHPFERMRARSPEAIALTACGRSYTYRDLGKRVDRLANVLRQRGVGRGDRVAAFMPNRMEFVVTLLATLRAGAVFMPIGALTRSGRLAALFEDAEPACLVTEERLAGVWEGPARDCASLRTVVVCDRDFDAALGEASGGAWEEPRAIDQDLAVLLYTSGSRGEPKGVMLTHHNLRSAMGSILSYLGLRADDVILCALPLTFGYGLGHVFLAFEAGARLVLEASFSYPIEILETMARERITVFPGVPTMFALLLAQGRLSQVDLSALRILTNAGAALPDETVRRLRSRLPRARLFAMYGQTECTRVTYLPPEEIDLRPNSVGRGMANQEIYLVDDAGRRLPPGSTGELVVRGSHVMRGYWRRPVETSQKLRPGEIPGELVLHTGDIFRTDEEGYLYFLSRSDDVIKCRGEKVSPLEIENVLHTLEGVLEAAVFGVPDPTLGLAIKAFVAVRPGFELTPRDVRGHCASRLESIKVPQHVVFLPSLPKTPNGKVDKKALLSGPRSKEGEKRARHQA